MWGVVWGALVAALSSVVSAVALLFVTKQLWSLRWSLSRDKRSSLPLPRGSMGWPLVGETFHWLLQGSNFHISRRERHGNVFKTHLLGKPVVRVTGSDNIRKILLGEHSLVCTQWPQSTRTILGHNTLVNSIGDIHRTKRKILAKVFSRGALQTYLPRVQAVVRGEVAKWCSAPGSVDVYACAKALTFRVAVRVLLGLALDEERTVYLARTFEQLMDNLFSLPIDAPFSGLRKGIKAREILHANMEQIIEEKMSQQHTDEYYDAFDYMMSSAKEHGHHLTRQELKETAVELIFAAHSTTASASTSLVLQLLRHPAVAHKARLELEAEGLRREGDRERDHGHEGDRERDHGDERERERDHGREGEREREDGRGAEVSRTPQDASPRDGPQPGVQKRTVGGDEDEEKQKVGGSSFVVPGLTLERLSRLRYMDSVVKEVLRFLPPVSGGYRTALQTFELDGYQIPKGWSVMYSIRDTHETAAVFQNPGTFDPERFFSASAGGAGASGGGGEELSGGRSGGGRFSYVPFGGGARSCVGKELAQVILKTLAVELLAATDDDPGWTLATAAFPEMQTVPIVHPVNGLHVHFRYGGGGGAV